MEKSNINILLCDGNELLMNVLKVRLEKEHYTVLTSNNQQSAKYILSNYKIHLLISSVISHSIDGFDLLKYINENKLKQIIVFFLSKVNNIEIISQAFNLNVTEYITKPFDPEMLVIKIKKVFKIENII